MTDVEPAILESPSPCRADEAAADDPRSYCSPVISGDVIPYIVRGAIAWRNLPVEFRQPRRCTRCSPAGRSGARHGIIDERR